MFYLLEVSGQHDSERSCKDPGSNHERSVKLEEDLRLALQLGDDPEGLRFAGRVFRSVLSDAAVAEGALGQQDDVTILQQFEGLTAVFGCC